MEWIFLFVMLGYALFSAYAARLVLQPKTFSSEASFAKEVRDGKFDQAEYDAIAKEMFELQGAEEVCLKGEIWRNPIESHRYVILPHGFSYTRYGMVKYALLYYKLGYHCVLYDHRYHGQSGGSFLSMGHFEQKDLLQLIQSIRQQDAQASIGLHGESLGAATCLLVQRFDIPLAFIVSDCAYSSLWSELAHQMKQQFRLPAWCLWGPLVYVRLVYGFSLRSVNPIDIVRQSTTPTLFIHGMQDSFTPYAMSEEMAKVHPGKHRLSLYDNSNHAMCIVDEPLRYAQELETFLKGEG